MRLCTFICCVPSLFFFAATYRLTKERRDIATHAARREGVTPVERGGILSSSSPSPANRVMCVSGGGRRGEKKCRNQKNQAACIERRGEKGDEDEPSERAGEENLAGERESAYRYVRHRLACCRKKGAKGVA